MLLFNATTRGHNPVFFRALIEIQLLLVKEGKEEGRFVGRTRKGKNEGLTVGRDRELVDVMQR